MYLVENLTFSYGSRNVFNDLSFELKQTITGIIGVNGAGKTTLTKLSLHLLTPQKGRILINNIEMTDVHSYSKANVGVLHENARFPPWTRVFDYLVWVGKIRGFTTSEAKEQATLFLRELDLIDRQNSRVSELSAGLKQRFGIAQAFIGLPDFIFLDEPTANLDARSRIQVLELIRGLSSTYGLQVVIFSHILSDLEKYCDEVLILHNGEVKYQNDIKQVFQDVFIKEYLLRVAPNKITQLKNELLKHNITILSEHDESNLILKLKTPDELTTVQKLISTEDASLTPYKTALEELFFDLTSDEKQLSQSMNA